MPVTFKSPGQRPPATMQRLQACATSFQRPRIRLNPARRRPVRFAPAVGLQMPFHPADTHHVLPEPAGQNEPYVGFDRRFTPEGGIEYAFLAHDERLWCAVLRFLAFAWIMGMTLTMLGLSQPHFLTDRMTQEETLASAVIFLVTLALSGWYFFRQHYVDASIEIRKDRMIIDGDETFWRFHMLGLPEIVPQPDGTHLFQVTYGSRFIVFFRFNRTEPEDRFPELLTAQLQIAMQQLWRE